MNIIEKTKLLQSKKDLSNSQIKCIYDFVLNTILEFHTKFGIEMEGSNTVLKLNSLLRTGNIVLFIASKLLELIQVCIQAESVEVKSNSFIVRNTLKTLFGIKLK